MTERSDTLILGTLAHFRHFRHFLNLAGIGVIPEAFLDN